MEAYRERLTIGQETPFGIFIDQIMAENGLNAKLEAGLEGP